MFTVEALGADAALMDASICQRATPLMQLAARRQTGA